MWKRSLSLVNFCIEQYLLLLLYVQLYIIQSYDWPIHIIAVVDVAVLHRIEATSQLRAAAGMQWSSFTSLEPLALLTWSPTSYPDWTS